jgi:hypothetical protein
MARGEDRRVTIHRTVRVLGFLALVLHPVLVLVGYVMWGAPYPLTFPY